MESEVRSDAFGHATPSYLYNSPVNGPTAKKLSIMHGNGHVPRESAVEGQGSSVDVLSQPGRQVQASSSLRNMNLITWHEDNLHRKRKHRVFFRW